MRLGKAMAVALALGALLTGCTAAVVRETADDLSLSVTELNQGLTSWQGALREDADGRIARIASQRVRLTGLEHDLKQRQAVWKLAGRKQVITLYEGIQEIVAAELEATNDLEQQLARERSNLKATQTKYTSLQKTLASLARQLRTLTEEPDPLEQIRFLVTFAEETNTALEELQEQVEGDSQ